MGGSAIDLNRDEDWRNEDEVEDQEEDLADLEEDSEEEPEAERPPDVVDPLRVRAEQGDLEAQYELGVRLWGRFEKMPVEAIEDANLAKDVVKEEALRCFEQAALHDHAASCFWLALRERAEGDAASAGSYLDSAANSGHKDAAKLLDQWKVEGFLPFEDDDEAILILEKADKRGVDSASYQLAERIREGRGVEPDAKRAVKLYTAAARNGHAASMYRLANCFEHGEGVKANAKTAAEWLEKSAALGHPEARGLLDSLNAASIAATDDAADGAALTAAAVKGDTASQLSLAMWHYSGFGVEQSFPLCYFWGKILAKSDPLGNDIAAMAKTQIKPALRKKLDEYAKVWKPGMAPPDFR